MSHVISVNISLYTSFFILASNSLVKMKSIVTFITTSMKAVLDEQLEDRWMKTFLISVQRMTAMRKKSIVFNRMIQRVISWEDPLLVIYHFLGLTFSLTSLSCAFCIFTMTEKRL